MIVMSPGSEIGMESLPDSIHAKRHLPAKGARLKDAVEETERYLIEEAYRELRSWKKVAEALGVDRTTIFRKATKYHIVEAIVAVLHMLHSCNSLISHVFDLLPYPSRAAVQRAGRDKILSASQHDHFIAEC